MRRVEKYKKIRSIKKKYMGSFGVFILIVILGICTADYSVNDLMSNEKRISLMTCRNNGQVLEIDFLNQRFELNTKYINRDYQWFKRMLSH